MALSGSFTGSTSNEYIQPKIVWSAKQSVSGNYSTVTATLYYSRTNAGYTTYGTWTGSITINGASVSASKRLEITQNSNTLAISHSVQVAHNADGRKSITISASGSMSGTTMTSTTISATVTLDTIARATTPTLSASSVNMGSAVTINTPRASSSFKHDLSYSFAGGSYKTIAEGVGTSYSWTTPDLASSIPNAVSGTVTIRCVTKNGSTTIGTKTVTLTLKVPASVVPTISSVVISEAVAGLAEQFGAYIQGKSKVKATITAAGAKGSTIKKYSTTFNGATYSSSSFTSNELIPPGRIDMVTTVTDSRGRTAKKTTYLTALEYTQPEIAAFNAVRCTADGVETNDGDHAKVSYIYKAPSLNGGNTIYLSIERRQQGAEEWETIHEGANLSDNALFILPDFSTDSQYDLRLTVSDWFGVSSTYPATIPTADVILDILADGKGVAFGKVAELTNTLDVDWKLRTLGGEEYVVLETGTDFNTLTTPNKYASKSANNEAYTNCPVTSGTFTLEVKPCGDVGQLMQRVTTCNKTAPRVYERYYYSSAWGDWICVSSFGGTVLWSGVNDMGEGKAITLSEPVSIQKTGIVLVFSRYSNSTAQNYHFNSFFVSSKLVELHPGVGNTFIISTDGTFSAMATKYLYIHDDSIVGNANNTKSGTATTGIVYSNSGFVLRYVIGV